MAFASKPHDRGENDKPSSGAKPQTRAESGAREIGGMGANFQTDVGASALALQRAPVVGEGSVSTPAPPAERPNVPQSGGVIVDDTATAEPGQLRRSEFMAQVRSSLTVTCDQELGRIGRTSENCPYLQHWLGHYENQSARDVERAVQRYAQPTPGTDARGLVEAVISRAGVGVRRWIETGQTSDIPGMTTATEGDSPGGVQRQSLGKGPSAPPASDPVSIQARLGAGSGLDTGVRSRMEHAMGASFGNVRVHTDGTASQLSRSLSARAFTVGNDIAFGRDQYRPGTPEGSALIAHELAHTVQQRSGRAVTADGVENPRLEHEANRSAAATLLGDRTAVGGQSGLTLQRCDGCSSCNVPVLPTYSRSDLQAKVDGADTVSDIVAYVHSFPDSDRQTATSDLQSFRLDYIERMHNDHSLRATLGPRVVKLNEVLQALYAHVATHQAPAGTTPPGGRWGPGAIPPSLLAGTRTPTAAERTELGRAMTPVRTVGGVLPTFDATPVPPYIDGYEGRIRSRIGDWITDTHAQMVAGRGPVEHANAANLHPMTRFEEIAQVSKRESDAVFGSYATGSAFVAGVNLRDQWQDEEDRVNGPPVMPLADRVLQARNLVSYALNNDEQVQEINDQHGAVPSRAAEDGHLNAVRDHFSTTRTTELLEIDRGWPATADSDNAQVFLQLWIEPTDDANRTLFWDSFQTLIHEYLHTLAHPDYRTYADTFGYETAQYNTLIEGVNSLLTEIVWSTVAGRLAALKPEVEGAAFAAEPFNAALVPSITGQRYASYAQAMAMVNIVGIRNLYAAYFLGQTDLIRGT